MEWQGILHLTSRIFLSITENSTSKRKYAHEMFYVAYKKQNLPIHGDRIEIFMDLRQS